jgi:formamidopyrimidine-DNA glycosylase
MPELPEVETVVRQIRPVTLGQTIQRVVHAAQSMARSALGPFSRSLSGTTIERIDRHGKWMFLRLGGERTLVVHLGMTGRLGVVPSETPLADHTHLRLLLSNGTELRFSDARRFGELWLIGPEQFAARFGPDRLGPDALAISPRQFRDGLHRTRRALKAALLDQRLVAGVGNIYADEILFAARLHPALAANRLRSDDAARLRRVMTSVLRRAIRYNGTSIRDYVTAQGTPGEFQQRLCVYGRVDLPCKVCASPIQLTRKVVSGRATYWCPTCQPLYRAAAGTVVE